MCRYIAYMGPAAHLTDLLYEPTNGLIHQASDAMESRTHINADGFGIGWYGNQPEPGTYRHVRPAWNDTNLQALAAQIESSMFLAHVRATTGSPVQRTNCHPFNYGRWLFVHNGAIS